MCPTWQDQMPMHVKLNYLYSYGINVNIFQVFHFLLRYRVVFAT